MTPAGGPETARPVRQQRADPGPGDAAPLGDVTAIIAELERRGMGPGDLILLSYRLRFRDPETASRAAAEARRDGWTAASYRWSSDDVVRLTRQGRVDARELLTDCEYLRRLAAARGGQWDALWLEGFAADGHWAEIADRLIEQTTATPTTATPPLPRQRDRRASARRSSA